MADRRLPDEVICPGACNSRYRRAWDGHTRDMAAWRHLKELAAAEDEGAAEKLPEAPEVSHPSEEGSGVSGQLSAPPGRIRVPPPPEPPTVKASLGNPVWCGRCARQIKAALCEIDELAAVLDAWSDGRRGPTSQMPVSRRRADSGTPSPPALVLDELYGEVTDAEDKWRIRRGYPQVRRGSARSAHHRQTAIAFLIANVDDMLAVRELVEQSRRWPSWVRLLQALTGSEPVVRRRPGRCPSCGQVGGLWSDVDGLTKCRMPGCGRWLTEAEYEDQVLDVADAGMVGESKRRGLGSATPE